MTRVSVDLIRWCKDFNFKPFLWLNSLSATAARECVALCPKHQAMNILFNELYIAPLHRNTVQWLQRNTALTLAGGALQVSWGYCVARWAQIRCPLWSEQDHHRHHHRHRHHPDPLPIMEWTGPSSSHHHHHPESGLQISWALRVQTNLGSILESAALFKACPPTHLAHRLWILNWNTDQLSVSANSRHSLASYYHE